MWRPVISEKVVKSGVLFSGLRLLQDPVWRMGKDQQELEKIGAQIAHIMQLHMASEELIIGIPVADQHVQLMEVPRQETEAGFHTLRQVSESAEGHFVRIKKIA